MMLQNANIPPLKPGAIFDVRLKRLIRGVLIAMSCLSGCVAVIALMVAGTSAMLAAIAGGLSQIVAVLAYARMGRIHNIDAPQAMLFRQMLAEVVKVVVALMLAATGFAVLFALGLQVLAPWLLVAVIAAQAAYWLVLVSK